MRVEIRSVNEKNEVVMWNRETDEIFKKEVSDEIAELYRKELEKVRVIETILYEEEKEKMYHKKIPKDEQVGFKLDSNKKLNRMPNKLSKSQQDLIDELYNRPKLRGEPDFISLWGKQFLKMTMLYFNDLENHEILELIKNKAPLDLMEKYKKSSNPEIEKTFNNRIDISDEMIGHSYINLLLYINNYEYK